MAYPSAGGCLRGVIFRPWAPHSAPDTLEENLHRKGLTPAERSKTYDDLRTAVEKRLLENASALVPQGPEGLLSAAGENPQRGGARPTGQVPPARGG
jgi:hypothetical protein